MNLKSFPDGINGISLRCVSTDGNKIFVENSVIFERSRNSIEFSTFQCGEDFVESGIPFYCSVEWSGSGNGLIKFDDEEKEFSSPKNPLLSVGSMMPPNHFYPFGTDLITNSNLPSNEFVIFTDQSQDEVKIKAVEWFGEGNEINLKVGESNNPLNKKVSRTVEGFFYTNMQMISCKLYFHSFL